MLQVQGISKRFDVGSGRSTIALQDLSFCLEEGQFVAMVGENGSGKSTLFRIITGEVRPDSGTLHFGSEDATGLPAHRRAKYVTHIHQSRQSGLPLSLTVEEVFNLAEASRSIDGKRREKSHVERLEAIRGGLSKVLGEQLWHLSGGEHQLVSLAVASIFAGGQPRGQHLLLLDEHVSQLDPIAHDVVMTATEHLVRASGLTAIMATHDCELAVKFGDRQMVLSHGQIAYDFVGPARIKSSAALKQCLATVSGREA